ncbi:hypothetical protein RJT34_33038 [Clitoria ternatea]|uniref:Stress-response A/B barrel domain-containing protein n=1 Tax=Clitoria ternatea TaxID=43366 RepID=A0AAN9I2V6_CLITE
MIEHVVLLKVKENVSASETNTIVERVNSLISLEHLLHLSMGPLFRIRSTPSSFNFTHMLHARFNSIHDLHAYALHPTHLALIKANAPFIHDIMALDWVAHHPPGGPVPPPASALRVTFFKLKDGLGDHVRHEVLGAISGIEFKQAIQLTCGENLSPERAKGFSIASLAVFPGLRELEALDSNEEVGNYQKNEKIKQHLESVMVLDYVLPSPEVSSSSS